MRNISKGNNPSSSKCSIEHNAIICWSFLKPSILNHQLKHHGDNLFSVLPHRLFVNTCLFWIWCQRHDSNWLGQEHKVNSFVTGDRIMIGSEKWSKDVMRFNSLRVTRLYKWFRIHLAHCPNLFVIRVVFLKRSVAASYLFHNHVHSISCRRLLKFKLKIMWKGPLRFFFLSFFLNNAERKLCKWVSQIIPLSERTTAVSKDNFFCLKTNNNDVM